MTAPRVVSLTSDFGLKDPYVGEMKAVILGISPDVTLVDVTHRVEKFNIQEGAFMLASAAKYFPKGTIHLAVVDPSVGTDRRPIIVETAQGFFVGPDNGLLMLAAEAQGIKQTRIIENRRLMLPHVSNTFHGRDVFAPAAAHLANGVSLDEFGSQVPDFVKPEFVKVTRSINSVAGVVLHVDDFGNIITNIRAREIAGLLECVVLIKFESQPPKKVKIATTYADASPQEPLALIGSHAFVEIALSQGDAAARFSVKAGDKVILSKP